MRRQLTAKQAMAALLLLAVADSNRTWKNYQQASVQRYVWDEMGRLSSLCGLTQGAKYTYRVDGLRVKKVEGLTVQWVDDGSSESEEESSGYYDEHWATNRPTTRYYYDGQMSFEDDYTVAGIGSNNTVTVTRYALGARGIDGIETQTTGQNASVVYPIYDGHGNMIATLSRNGTSFTRANNREYGVWGDIRSGSGGDQGYVANLGHRKDAESGLTYMRARYYEPGTGRFISEDTARHGPNWFRYSDNNPVNLIDLSGQFPWMEITSSAAVLAACVALIRNSRISHSAGIVAAAGMLMLAAWFTTDRFQMPGKTDYVFWSMSMWFTSHTFLEEIAGLAVSNTGADEALSSIGQKAVATVSNYFIVMSLFIYLEFMLDDPQ